MSGDIIGLKIGEQNVPAKAIAIIKKHNGLSFQEIQRHVSAGTYILDCPYADRIGIKRIIKCYEELYDSGVPVEIYEIDNKRTTIDFLRTLDKTYDNISEEIELTR